MCEESNLTCVFHVNFPSVQHTPLEQLDQKHFAKGSRRSEQNGTPAAPKEADNSKEIALLEAKLRKICELLYEVRICYSPLIKINL